MPFEIDPWTVPLEEKVELLRGVTAAIQKTPGILFATATAGFEYEWKYLATSEGSFIEQLFRFCNCSASATARTGHAGQDPHLRAGARAAATSS